MVRTRAFRGAKDPLSNFFACTINVFDEQFASAEHAYQFMKAKHHGMDDVAEKIQKQKTARDAKKATAGMKIEESWYDRRLDVVREVIKAKAEQVDIYRRELLKSGNLIIVEAVPGELFWSCGVANPQESWPGRNMMGELHMELRNKIRKRKVDGQPNSEKKKIKSEIEFDISSAIKILIPKGDYGLYVMVKRGERWVSLSESLWTILQKNTQRLTNIGDVLHLTKEKRVEVTEYQNKRYICFITERHDFKNFINLHEDEWKTLVETMPKIQVVLKDCKICHSLRSPVHVTKEKRVIESMLTPEDLANVEEHNKGCENQLGLTCTYCGAEGYLNEDGCHCHRYDCSTCMPDNFCSGCSALRFFEAERGSRCPCVLCRNW